MAQLRWIRTLMLVFAAGVACSRKPEVGGGSSQCRDCHPSFYQKWSTSQHGLAMQPFTGAFAQARLQSQAAPLTIGTERYRVDLDGGVVEQQGSQGTRKLPIAQVMGGKNTYYFLTPMERGRLQVLPLAYDVGNKSWYDMAASGVRLHQTPEATPLPWTDPAFTFNTSCYSCHVSQLRTNYNAADDSYHTAWKEPGINCETCHAGSEEHSVRMKGGAKEPGLARVAALPVEARNEMCAPCHAKMSPLSSTYQAGQRFFDHYDLVTLESADYYPDGRDLGENYTYTSWLMSGCARSGKLECLHCHTSAGRLRFAAEKADGACLPCHQEIAAKGSAHTHHKGVTCVGCHMPRTRFANMTRSDHSMRPPTPATTLKYQSPNACNVCHRDKDAAWAEAKSRAWYGNAYQQPALERAALIDAARRRQWERLPAMLAYLNRKDGDPVVETSLLRLLRASDDPAKIPVLAAKLASGHPLVRAAAAAGLAEAADTEGLVKALGDEYRLVRIRAAASLAGSGVTGDAMRKATAELIESYQSRPDDFANLTNLGNFYLRRGETEQAVGSFERALRLRPDAVGTIVNASVAYGRAGRTADAERILRQALERSPKSAAVNFNLGLVLAETGRTAEAEKALRAALAADPNLAAAAYNLAILTAASDLRAAIALCRKAAALQPRETKYAMGLAQFLLKGGQPREAVGVLQEQVAMMPSIVDPYALLGEVLERVGRTREAAAVYRLGAANSKLPPPVRKALEDKAALTSRGSSATPRAVGR